MTVPKRTSLIVFVRIVPANSIRNLYGRTREKTVMKRSAGTEKRGAPRLLAPKLSEMAHLVPHLTSAPCTLCCWHVIIVD